MPVALLELPTRAANDCSVPTIPCSATVVLGPSGEAADVTMDRDLVSERVGRCIADVTGAIDVSEWIEAVKTNYFQFTSIELEYFWRDGRPLESPRGPD